jgi:hypothetical protein
MKKFLLIFSMPIIHFTALAQSDFGLTINGGVSYFTTKLESQLPPTQSQKFYPMPSGQGGMFYNLHLHSKFLFGAELLFVPIEGKEVLKTEELDQNGAPTGLFITDNLWRHVYYLGLPVYFGYNLKKVNVNLGFQVNYTLASGGKEKGEAPFNGSITTWEYTSDKLAIDKYDYGVRAGFLYKLNDQFSIEANYYHGLNNILEDTQISNFWKWKVQQMTVGLHYTFKTIGVPPEE